MTEPTTEELVERLRDQRHLMQGDGLVALLATTEQAAQRLSDLEGKLGEARKALEQVSDAPKLPSSFGWTGIDELEGLFDAELRHANGKKPYDYLKAWLSMFRPFAYATRDDSWGELEKLIGIVMRNYVRMIAKAELASEALKLTASGGGEDNSLSQGAKVARDSARPDEPHSAGGREP